MPSENLNKNVEAFKKMIHHLLIGLAILFVFPTANAGSIVDILGKPPHKTNNHALMGAELVDMKPQVEGNGMVAYLRRPRKLPEIVWYSSAWEVLRAIQVEAPANALSVTPAATKNDLLLIGSDGRVCVEASVKHPYGHRSYRIRWQVSCYTKLGEHLWTAASNSNERDIANGIALRHDGGINVIKSKAVTMLDSASGNVMRTIPLNLKKNVNNTAYFFDDGLIAFKHSLDKTKSASFQQIKIDGHVEWEMPLKNISVSGAIVKKRSNGGYLFGATDYDSRGERTGKRGYIGAITIDGKLKWIKPIDIKDARLVDFIEIENNIYVVMARGYGYASSGARTFIVALTKNGEVIETIKTSKKMNRLPLGILVSKDGHLIVYGAAKNFPDNVDARQAFMQKKEPWIGKVNLNK